MTQLYEIKVKLSENQKRNLSRVFHQRETIVLRLPSNALSGSDTLYVPSNIVKRLNKDRRPWEVGLKLPNKIDEIQQMGIAGSHISQCFHLMTFYKSIFQHLLVPPSA